MANAFNAGNVLLSCSPLSVLILHFPAIYFVCCAVSHPCEC